MRQTRESITLKPKHTKESLGYGFVREALNNTLGRDMRKEEGRAVTGDHF